MTEAAPSAACKAAAALHGQRMHAAKDRAVQRCVMHQDIFWGRSDTDFALHAAGTVSDSNIAADASGGNITSTSSNSAVSNAGDGSQIKIGQGGDGVGGV